VTTAPAAAIERGVDLAHLTTTAGTGTHRIGAAVMQVATSTAVMIGKTIDRGSALAMRTVELDHRPETGNIAAIDQIGTTETGTGLTEV
jgi:hypothetical protein